MPAASIVLEHSGVHILIDSSGLEDIAPYPVRLSFGDGSSSVPEGRMRKMIIKNVKFSGIR